MKTINERVATVLQQIEEQLAMAKLATSGPFHHRADCRVYDQNGCQVAKTVSPDFSNLQDLQNATFIAASRTGYPIALECLKTAIEGLLGVLSVVPVTLEDHGTQWHAGSTLTTIIERWEAARK